MFDYTVFIGRFQIPHYGHFNVILEALQASHKVIIALGSSNVARSIRNPFRWDERIQMFNTCGVPEITEAIRAKRIIFVQSNDHTYMNGAWVKEIQTVVEHAIYCDCPVLDPNIMHNGMKSQINPEAERRSREGVKIALIGCNKDNTSFYLSLFPQWDSIAVHPVKMYNSTDLRNDYFTADHLSYQDDHPTTQNVIRWLHEFKKRPEYQQIREEYEWVRRHKEMWAVAPFPPTFNTVDAVVIQSGHVLLVKRRAMPGKGMWALPGGYLNQDETLEQAMLRELREETRINVNDKILRSNIVKDETFADPHRSPRGRTITQAFLIHLPNSVTLPKVKGSDDAEKAKWVPLASLRADELFEDHYWIISKLIADL